MEGEGSAIRNQSAGVTGQVNRPCGELVYFETPVGLTLICDFFVSLKQLSLELIAMLILALVLNNLTALFSVL